MTNAKKQAIWKNITGLQVNAVGIVPRTAQEGVKDQWGNLCVGIRSRNSLNTGRKVRRLEDPPPPASFTISG